VPISGAAGQWDEAVAAYQRACSLWEPLAEARPDDLRAHSALGGNLHNLAWVLTRLDRNDEALAAYRRAVVEQRQAFDKAPQVPPHRRFLSNHYRNLALLLRKLRRPQEAADACRRWKELWPDDPSELCKVASSLAACVSLVGEGKTELSPEEQAERRRYADEAMAVLRQAVAKGFRDAKALQQGPLGATLGPRDDFQQLRRELEAQQAVPAAPRQQPVSVAPAEK
jgi:tetratricopeptide (TPR) repeat protein